jgi:V/A-type H+/Na+-transporting ATPase subunit K
MKKLVIAALLAFALLGIGAAAQGSPQAADQAQAAVQAAGTPIQAWKYISAALAVGFACIGGGLAVGKLGAAAMGALAEDASLSGKALPYLGLAEGICLWGFLVALLILMV